MMSVPHMMYLDSWSFTIVNEETVVIDGTMMKPTLWLFLGCGWALRREMLGRAVNLSSAAP